MNIKYSELSTYEKADRYAKGRCTAVQYNPEMCVSAWMPRVAGKNVTTGKYSSPHKTKENAIQEAKEFRELCRNYLEEQSK